MNSVCDIYVIGTNFTKKYKIVPNSWKWSMYKFREMSSYSFDLDPVKIPNKVLKTNVLVPVVQKLQPEQTDRQTDSIIWPPR